MLERHVSLEFATLEVAKADMLGLYMIIDHPEIVVVILLHANMPENLHSVPVATGKLKLISAIGPVPLTREGNRADLHRNGPGTVPILFRVPAASACQPRTFEMSDPSNLLSRERAQEGGQFNVCTSQIL